MSTVRRRGLSARNDIARWALGVACLAVVAGCRSVPTVSQADWERAHRLAQDRRADPSLTPYYERFYAEGERNAALNLMRLGKRALTEGQWKDAKWAFDECILRIEAMDSGNPAVEEAKSTFEKEEIKPFKGEPYERCMVYLYRALLYYQDSQYDNAIACCKNVQLQDQAGAGYRADFAVAEFLTAVCYQKMGRASDAQEAMNRLAKTAGLEKPVRLPASPNILVVAESGDAPYKRARGRYGERLRFSEMPDTARAVRLEENGKELPQASVAEDLFFQATSRGGRRMDELLEDKADFKQATSEGGDLLIIGGALAAIIGARGHNDTATLAGLGALGAGFASKGLSASADPEADTRTWDNLPHNIYLIAAEAPAGNRDATVEYLGERGDGISETKIQLEAKQKVIWVL